VLTALIADAYWIRVDQLVHAWIFATILKDTLSKVRDLSYSMQWQHFESRFNMARLACALDLKRMLTNI